MRKSNNKTTSATSAAADGKKDVCQIVTDRIIEQLEKGIIPWQKPWLGCVDGAISYVTRKPYSLLNQMLLGKAGEWLSFKQISDLGGRVKAGEKGSMITFWKTFVTKENEGTPDEKERKAFCLRYYYVWHIDQTEGIKSKITTTSKFDFQPSEKAENIIKEYIARTGITLTDDKPSDSAFYSPARDSITVPCRKQYTNFEEFYSTLFHEMTHSTGHTSRLNRDGFADGNIAMFGDESYSKEELIAEIGAATLVQHCGLETTKSFKNSAAYIQSWLTKLKSDKRFVISACSKATAATRYILGLPTGFDD